MLRRITYPIGCGHNPTFLLSLAKQETGSLKTLVVYGRDAIFNAPKQSKFAVIHIFRTGKEYRCNVSKYRKVKSS